jgi:hypothetical protein
MMLPYSAVDMATAIRRELDPILSGQVSARPDQSPSRSTLLGSLRERLAALLLA